MIKAKHIVGTVLVGVAIVSLYLSANTYPVGILPPKNIGVINKTQTLAEICSPSFRTGTIRPSTSYTDKIKKTLINGKDGRLYELDHALPITDDGDPRDPNNLWLEPWHINYKGYDLGAKTKDVLEAKLHNRICSGEIKPEEALDIIHHWPLAYKKYVGEWPKYMDGLTGFDGNDE